MIVEYSLVEHVPSLFSEVDETVGIKGGEQNACQLSGEGTILAFLRISTNPGLSGRPLRMEEAAAVVDEWLGQPNVDILTPGERHWEILRGLLKVAQVRGALTSDAHLAALAIEHGATLCTCDRDFTRFPGLRILNPLPT